jgi:hypothetical protein
MDQAMKVISAEGLWKAMGPINGRMAVLTLGSGGRISNMVKGASSGRMEVRTKVSTKMTNATAVV